MKDQLKELKEMINEYNSLKNEYQVAVCLRYKSDLYEKSYKKMSDIQYKLNKMIGESA